MGKWGNHSACMEVVRKCWGYTLGGLLLIKYSVKTGFVKNKYSLATHKLAYVQCFIQQYFIYKRIEKINKRDM